jgi:transcriptional regulator with XRE-family HTH domain
VTKSTHTPEYRQLVTLIEETRKSVGLTQQEVARRLQKPQSYIAKVEGAERRIDVIEFIAFAKAYEVDPLELFKRMIEKNRKI